LTNIRTGLTIENIKTINLYIGIDEIYYSSPPWEKNEKFFQYYRYFDSTGSLNRLGVMVKTYHNSYGGPLFQISKAGNTVRLGIEYVKSEVEIDFQSLIDLRGKVRIYNLLGLELMNYGSDILTMNLINRKDDVSFIDTYDVAPKNTEDIVLAKGLRTSVTNISDNSSPNQLKLSFGTDLTNYNKATFPQSLIDNTTMNNPNNNLFQTIANGEKFSTTIKTLVGDNIFPKTTNTLLTVYYTSYIKTNIPEVTDTTRKTLVRYYTNATYPAISISVINSTYYTSPRLYILILISNCNMYKEYTISTTNYKAIYYLTADLATARPRRNCNCSVSS
jgi:hypothetical protein